MRKITLALPVLLMAGFTGAPAYAAGFTADAVQTSPGQSLRYGKLTVKDHLSRFEFQMRGRPVVQITDKNNNKTRFLFPLSRTYFEVDSTPDAESDGDFAFAKPCPEAPDVTCAKDKEEKLGGFTVEKWRISSKNSPRPVYVWWNKERKMALRRELLSGGVQQMLFRGTMPYDQGRMAEDWEVLYLMPYGRYDMGSVRYDPALKVAVSQNFPGGQSRDLHNIAVVDPDPALFTIPERYKKVDAPKPPERPKFQRPADLPGMPPMPSMADKEKQDLPRDFMDQQQKAKMKAREDEWKKRLPPMPPVPPWAEQPGPAGDMGKKADDAANRQGWPARPIPPWARAQNAPRGNAAAPGAYGRPFENHLRNNGRMNHWAPPRPYGYPGRPMQPAPQAGAQPAK